MPDLTNVSLFEWLVSNGIAVVFLLLFMRWVASQIRQILNTFADRLDNIATNNTSSLKELTNAFNDMRLQMATLTEVQRSVVTFISQNMAEIIAHRTAVEHDTGSLNIPNSPMGKTKEPTPDVRNTAQETDIQEHTT